jgi:hypothetical protein
MSKSSSFDFRERLLADVLPPVLFVMLIAGANPV